VAAGIDSEMRYVYLFVAAGVRLPCRYGESVHQPPHRQMIVSVWAKCHR
jgi:hypothetical protein